MLVPAIVVCFLVTLVFIVALRPMAIVIGLVDLPGGRKSHVGAIPIVGGAAMFIGILLGLALLADSWQTANYLMASASLLVLIGLLDDRFGIPASARLVTQITAVLIMVYGGNLLLHDLGDPFGFGTLGLGPVKLLITTLVTVSVINAFNLVDGVDGLAGLLAVTALAAAVAVSGLANPASMIALVTISAIAAYLIFNLPLSINRQIRCFMGDAGSTLLGFIVVWVILSISQGPDRVVSPVIGLWFASIPIYDLFTCFVRRIYKGHSPFKPGRDHFHHTLKRGGLGVREVVVVLTCLQLLYAGIGIGAHLAGIADVIMFAAWAMLGFLQRWLIRKSATFCRLNRLKLRATGETGKYARPGTF
jgi:UDP-GlcNAc:undecaprenyl-phosphate GlcNAc-1-phosphate transferase